MAETHDTSWMDGLQRHPRPECLHCELTLTDALDGMLDEAEQAAFDRHIASCTRCAELYAEAQRGAAWLDLLKSPRPEPRPELLANILAATSGSDALEMPMFPVLSGPQAFADPLIPARLLPFRPRPTAPSAMERLGRLMLEPRLAMTAAMAFFSITLTMSLTGVRLNDMHASDFSPSGLRRTAHAVEASAVRYYDNLRVVHVLESRVDDLRDSFQQRRQEEMPAPAHVEPGTPESGKPGSPAGDGGTSSTRPLRTERSRVLSSAPRHALHISRISKGDPA